LVLFRDLKMENILLDREKKNIKIVGTSMIRIILDNYYLFKISETLRAKFPNHNCQIKLTEQFGFDPNCSQAGALQRRVVKQTF